MKAKILAALFSVLIASNGFAVPMVGLGADARLYYFDSESPNTIVSSVAISNLQAGETLVGIDTRPLTGELFGIGSQGRVYFIASDGRAATLSTAPVLLDGTSFGIDFNPTVDRIRFVSNNDQNLRFNQLTGALAATDTVLTPAGDKVGAAYDRNVPGGTLSTLFLIDSSSDTLAIQGGADGTPSPNGGVITNIGPLGVNTSDVVGFDISASGVPRALLSVGGVPAIYSINLTTGAATAIGIVANGITLTDISFVPRFPQPVLVTSVPSMSTIGLWVLGTILVLGGLYAGRRFS